MPDSMAGSVQLLKGPMATKQATSSYSMSRALHSRLHKALPRHGDRSKLVARLIEMWLDHEIMATNVFLRSNVSVVQSNTKNPITA